MSSEEPRKFLSSAKYYGFKWKFVIVEDIIKLR